jgi:hypothetical protein
MPCKIAVIYYSLYLCAFHSPTPPSSSSIVDRRRRDRRPPPLTHWMIPCLRPQAHAPARREGRPGRTGGRCASRRLSLVRVLCFRLCSFCLFEIGWYGMDLCGRVADDKYIHTHTLALALALALAFACRHGCSPELLSEEVLLKLFHGNVDGKTARDAKVNAHPVIKVADLECVWFLFFIF